MKTYFAVMAGLCLAQPAMAASAPPNTVILGTSAKSLVFGANKHVCSSPGGPAGFQRGVATAGKANPPAIISLTSLVLSGVLPNFSFTGVVVLHFTSATDGVAAFDYNQAPADIKLPSGRSFPFSNYSQVWTPSVSTLKVNFNILFPDCTLPVRALFRTIP